jgi:ATP-dependent Clp protease adaptor protein ClpS
MQSDLEESVETLLEELKPKKYKVIFLNDDITTMDFVVEVLINIFNKNSNEAVKITMDIHNNGRGIVGIYIFEIASEKQLRTRELAKKRNFPLQVILEEE